MKSDKYKTKEQLINELAQLRQSEKAYSTLVEKGNDGIIVIQDGCLAFANTRMVEMTGFSLEEALGKPFLDFVTPDYRALAADRYKKRMMGEAVPDRYEAEVLSKKGAKIPIEINASLIEHEGKPAVMAIVRDMTEHKKAEEALRSREKQLSLLFNTVDDAIFTLSVEPGDSYRFTSVNRRFLEATGLSEKQIVGKRMQEVIPQSAHALVLEKYKEAIRTGNSSHWGEVSIYPAGEKAGEVTVTPVFDKDGNCTQLFGTVHDITEHKQAEKVLRQSETKYRLLLENSGIGVGLFDLDGRILIFNRQAIKNMGGIPEDYIGKTVVEVFGEQTGSEYIRRFRLTAVSESSLEFEDHVQLPTGDYWFLSNHTRVLNDDGQVIGVQVLAHDITERKQAEEKIRLSEEMFSNAFNLGPAGITITQIADGKFINANESFCRMFEFNRNEVIGHTSTELNMWTQEERRRVMQQQLEAGGLRNYELVARSKSGRLVNVLFSSKEIQVKGEACHLTNMVDITERKRAELALSEAKEIAEKSLAGLHIALQAGQAGYYDMNLANRVASCSEEFEEMYGVRRGEFNGKPMKVWEERVLAEDLPQVLADFQHAIDEGYATSSAFRIRRRDNGELRWIEARGRTLYDSDHMPVRMIGVNIDITKRIQAEETLRRSEQKYRTLVENIPQKIFLKDKDSVYISCNANYARDLKLEPDEITGKTDFEFYPKELAEKYRADDRRIMESGKTESIEEEYIQDGQKKVVQTFKVPVKDAKGNVVGVFGIFQDITERRQMQEKLILTDRLAAVGQLAAGIAHELNNPLTSIIGFSELVAGRQNLPADVKEDVEIINREAQRTAEVVKGLLAFARKQKAGKELVDIHSIIKGVLQLRSYEQRVSNIEVDTRFAPDLPQIMGNGAQLQQVIINLIINAEQAMLEAHNRGKLTIVTERVGDMIRLSIADDGPGISPENLRKLFTPFFTTKEVGKGTGLGLSICHGIVTEHGGNVYAESEPGKGATFIVELPTAK